MKEINYVLTSKLGIHARPAGKLVRLATEFDCDIQIGRPGKMVNAKQIIGIMGLCMKQGDTLTMTFNGPGEEIAAAAAMAFLEENL